MYSLQNAEIAKEHLRYLKEIEDLENKRQEIIENKSSQLLGQLTVIFAILGLTSPLAYYKSPHLCLVTRILLITCLSLCLYFIMRAVFYSILNLNIKKYKYILGSPQTILNVNNNKLEIFLQEEINDKIKAIEHNQEINNTKGTYLLKSYNAFKNGLIFFSIIIIIYLLNIFF